MNLSYFLSKKTLIVVFALSIVSIAHSAVDAPEKTPLRQSDLSRENPGSPQAFTLRDATRDDRWYGVGVNDVRWAPDGKYAYFQWHPSPMANQDATLDPWYRVDRDGTSAQVVAADSVHLIPAAKISWHPKDDKATWIKNNRLYVYDSDSSPTIRSLYSTDRPLSQARFLPNGQLHFMQAEDLYQYDLASSGIRQLTHKTVKHDDPLHAADEWREQQQLELFERFRKDKQDRENLANYKAAIDPLGAQIIPVGDGEVLEDIQLTPDGRHVTFRVRTPNEEDHPTHYMGYATASGEATAYEARPKVGGPRHPLKLGIIAFDPGVALENIAITWVQSPQDRPVDLYGPYWNQHGTRAVVQILSKDHKDLWISQLDIAAGTTTIITHDHDDAWLGGPPLQSNNSGPTFLQWLPDDSFVFASERSGWSHLYRVDNNGTVRALTQGDWEVRDAALSRDKTRWLLTASREHPSDDHLYSLPVAGGKLQRLSNKPGRHASVLSPDGQRLATIYSESRQLPDLFLSDFKTNSPTKRITVSGTDNAYTHLLTKPSIVSFPHKDGQPVYAALFTPEDPHPLHPAIVHIHGGGYRHFSHHGWSVYGYSLHLGLINYLVQEGYTVLDLDYRGSAGYGRDYRTDIYRAMGVSDVQSVEAGVDYLVDEHNIDRTRIGMYGVSYGGFLTLATLFTKPGLMAAGIANAAVSDWAHYNHGYTARILNQVQDDPEAYQIASPINHAAGLADPLLIVHGLIDENVHFQDAARVTLKLIEEEKQFEVMYYPMERHVIATEASRFDYGRRLVGFFNRHLLR